MSLPHVEPCRVRDVGPRAADIEDRGRVGSQLNVVVLPDGQEKAVWASFTLARPYKALIVSVSPTDTPAFDAFAALRPATRGRARHDATGDPCRLASAPPRTVDQSSALGPSLR